ncbi:MAG: GNAT family N-acetyltransferase, partial [Zhenhengia sp.]
GIGKAIIEALVDYSKSRKLEVLLLEVRESNEPAKSLYSLNGFKEIGKRKNYYTKPTEDALLMALALEE